MPSPAIAVLPFRLMFFLRIRGFRRSHGEPAAKARNGCPSGLNTLPCSAFSSVDLFYPLPGDTRGDLCAANLTRRRLENQFITREFEEAFLLCPDVIRKYTSFHMVDHETFGFVNV